MFPLIIEKQASYPGDKAYSKFRVLGSSSSLDEFYLLDVD